MKIAVLICRILLGLAFLVSGVFKFFPIPAANIPPGDAGAWTLLMIHHHWMEVVGVFESVGGLLLISGRFVPLGLTLVAPVCFNILLFGLLFVPRSPGAGLVVSAFELFLIYAYRGHFAPLFDARAKIS